MRGYGLWAEARRERRAYPEVDLWGASTDASAQKTCRPPGCAEIGLGLRCSVGRVSLGIHSLPRASPQANLSATNVKLFRRHHTKFSRIQWPSICRKDISGQYSPLRSLRHQSP